MGSRKKALASEQEVEGAVDELLLSMGLGPDAALPNDDDENSFDDRPGRVGVQPVKNAKEDSVPSAALDALWGQPARKK